MATTLEHPNTATEGVDPVETALAYVAAHRDAYHRDTKLDDATVAHLRAAGVYRALVPAALGGSEMHPADFLRLVERIAVADGSAGWIASFGAWKLVTAALPSETYATIHAEGPDVLLANAGFPFEAVESVAGGFRISGRRHFSSGVSHAAFVAIGIVTESGENRLAVLPRDAVTPVPEWNVIGLRGTGSYDLLVDDVFVPIDWTFVRGSQPAADAHRLHLYPVMILSAQSFAAVGLGAARAALDTLAALAGGRASVTGGPVLADKPHVQIAFAEATAALEAARAWFYAEAEKAAGAALAGNPVSRDQRVAMRLSASHATATAAWVARTAFEQAGTAGLQADHPLARRMQDAQTVGQHAMLSAGTWQGAGQALLGLEPPKGYP